MGWPPHSEHSGDKLCEGAVVIVGVRVIEAAHGAILVMHGDLSPQENISRSHRGRLPDLVRQRGGLINQRIQLRLRFRCLLLPAALVEGRDQLAVLLVQGGELEGW